MKRIIMAVLLLSGFSLSVSAQFGLYNEIAGKLAAGDYKGAESIFASHLKEQTGEKISIIALPAEFDVSTAVFMAFEYYRQAKKEGVDETKPENDKNRYLVVAEEMIHQAYIKKEASGELIGSYPLEGVLTGISEKDRDYNQALQDYKDFLIWVGTRYYGFGDFFVAMPAFSNKILEKKFEAELHNLKIRYITEEYDKAVERVKSMFPIPGFAEKLKKTNFGEIEFYQWLGDLLKKTGYLEEAKVCREKEVEMLKDSYWDDRDSIKDGSDKVSPEVTKRIQEIANEAWDVIST
ncbi:MAG: hypothetical protein NTW04_05115, partial [Elusimicrobia bacterium]|nr:hypothetical protein [Elusimicrobiota bacterium]